MDNQTQQSLTSFAQKALQRLEDKKTVKHRTLFVPSLDQNIKIRNLTQQEVLECTSIDETSDPNKADRYSVYLSVVEPNLKETATELKKLGSINEYIDVVDIFEMSEVMEIATEVMLLSGVLGSKKVTVVDELKN